MSEVSRVGQERLEDVALVVARSFADDPVWQWIYDVDGPIPVDDAILLARMLAAGHSPADEILSAGHAVALWTAPAGSRSAEDEERTDRQREPHAVAFAERLGERISLVGRFGAGLREHHPDEPHWYLGILGTDPDHQGNGLGSKLMDTMLAKTDRLGLSTYLESSNPRNYGFYQRHGYTAAGEISVEGSPPLLRFIRPAR